MRWWANCTGITAAPFDAWLTLRGLRTLSARIDVQETNAQYIADYLNSHPKVETVYYPGLTKHPQSNIIQRQQMGPGTIMSFEIKGDINMTQTFLSALKLFSLAPSLGGTESLICHPAIMTHAAMDAPTRHIAGIQDNLIRISIGLEHIDDLTHDLTQAFSQV